MSFVCTILFALLFAELASGLFHWWEDRYGNPDWPILGDYIIKPNIDHHKHPVAFTRHSWWTRNNTTLIPCLFGSALSFYGWWVLDWPILWLAIGFLFLGHMNEVHSWTHVKCNPVIRFFQRYGILQSCLHHRIHHIRPYNRNYCALTNYTNPILEAIGLWTFLEWSVWLLFGAWPRPERELY